MADDSNLGPDTQTLPQTNYTRGSMPVGGQVAPDLGLSGVQTAMQLAQHAQNLDIQKKQFEMQKEQHQQMAMDKFLEVGSKIGKAKGPYQNVLFDYLQRTAPMAGMPPISEDLISSVKANQDKYSQLMGQLRANPKLMQDPQTMQALYAAHSGDPASLDDQIDKMQANITKQQGQQLIANALKSKLGQQAINRGVNPDDLVSDDSNVRAAALAKMGMLTTSTVNKNNAQGAAAAANAQTNATNAETKQAQVAETARHNPVNEANYAARTDTMAATAGTRVETSLQRIHQRYLDRVTKDPALQQKFTQSANIEGALNNVVNAQSLTPQQIDEFQQTIRSNLGIKGQGGVTERSNTYINDLGLTKERVLQFLSGDPAKISQDEALVTHLKDLAGLELKNVQNQTTKRLNTLQAGAGTFYSKHPDLKQDFLSTVDAARKQFASTPGLGGISSAPTGAAPKSDQSVNPTPVVQIISPDTIKKAVQINGAEKTRLYLIQKRGYSPADAAAAVGGQ